MGLNEIVAGTASPATRSSLCADLRGLSIAQGDLLLVHSSLSAMGWITGGAVTVLQALLEVLGETGTLVMPTHTPDGGDPAHWRHPPVPDHWHQIIRENRPVFEVSKTPSRAMGVLPELFRTWPGVLRSDHPIGSFAASGPLAQTIVEGHDLAEMLGERSPLGALYQHHARVLLLGVDHGSNTSLHLAEFRADWPGKPFITEGSRVTRQGRSEWVSYEMVRWDDDDFVRLGAAYEATILSTVGQVGCATARLLEQRPMVDFATEWLSSHRGRDEVVEG